MKLVTALLIVLLVMLLLAVFPGPFVPHAYGYWPGGLISILLIVLLILALTGRL